MTAAQFRAMAAEESTHKRSKYRAIAAYRCKSCDAPVTKRQAKCIACGGTEKRFFASRAEAQRYDANKARERRGEIEGLELQPAFPLVVNGIHVGVYKADSRYVIAATGETVVEDVKSEATMTEAARLRMKLAEACHGIKIRKVFKGRSAT